MDMRETISLCENMLETEPRTFFHIALTRNLPKILRDGLVPKKGLRSRAKGEQRPAIYMFVDRESADIGFEQWYADQFSEETRFAMLEVTVTLEIEIHSDVGYERHVYETIPPQNIRVLSRNYEGKLIERTCQRNR